MRIRKDIECTFGILVQRFHVLQRPLQFWYQNEICDLLDCCVILHNMIVDSRFEMGEVNNEDGNNAFPLFGRNQITVAEALLD